MTTIGANGGRRTADDQVLQARLGGWLRAQLEPASQSLPHDVQERLRAGREQALARARAAGAARPAPQVAGQAAPAVITVGRGSLGAGGGGWSRWAGGLLPLALLLGGLVVVGQFAAQQTAAAAADVDAELLSDNLPPSAYADPGFAAFLRAGDDAN